MLFDGQRKAGKQRIFRSGGGGGVDVIPGSSLLTSAPWGRPSTAASPLSGPVLPRTVRLHRPGRLAHLYCSLQSPISVCRGRLRRMPTGRKEDHNPSPLAATVSRPRPAQKAGRLPGSGFIAPSASATPAHCPAPRRSPGLLEEGCARGHRLMRRPWPMGAALLACGMGPDRAVGAARRPGINPAFRVAFASAHPGPPASSPFPRLCRGALRSPAV